MICPHCSTAVKYQWQSTSPFKIDDEEISGMHIAYALCPNCDEVVIYLQKGLLSHNNYKGHFVNEIDWEKLLYPKETNFENSEDIPKMYLNDYEEALKVLAASPKAS